MAARERRGRVARKGAHSLWVALYLRWGDVADSEGQAQTLEKRLLSLAAAANAVRRSAAARGRGVEVHFFSAEGPSYRGYT